MYKDYNVLTKEKNRFEKKFGHVEILAVPKDETTTITDINTALENNIEDFYIGLFRSLKRYEYGVYMQKVNEKDQIGLAEFICDTCWIKGDEIIKTDDDYFSSVYNNEPFLIKFAEHVLDKIKPFIIDEENYTAYIRKEGDKDFELKDVNDEDFYKLVFRKPSRNDMRQFYIQEGSLPAQENLLNLLCVEGNDDNLIMNNDNVFFTLIVGKEGQSSIADILMSKRISYLKKN